MTTKLDERIVEAWAQGRERVAVLIVCVGPCAPLAARLAEQGVDVGPPIDGIGVIQARITASDAELLAAEPAVERVELDEEAVVLPAM